MSSILRRAAALAAVSLGLLAAQPSSAADAWQDGMARQFRSLGLAPAAGRSYLQPLKLERQTLDPARSSVAVSDAISAETLSLLHDLVLDTSVRQPSQFEADLIFVGSKDPGPAVLHQVQGKVVVMLEATAGALDPAARAALDRAGVGFITLASRSPAPAEPGGAYLAGEDGARLVATLSPQASERLFARAGRPYGEAVALAEAGRPVPGFTFGVTLTARLALATRSLSTANLVGVVKGSDPLLSREYVVVSAAASSAAAVLDAARRLHDEAMKPRRSIIFAVFAPEQDGALGARAFALHPPAARDSLVASLNAATAPAEAAMVAVAAAEETSLGGLALDLAPSARPLAAAFSQATPYRFLETGVPAVQLTFGGGADAGFLLTLAMSVADSDAHPGWTRGSRFTPRAPRAREDLVAPIDLPRDHKSTHRFNGLAMLPTAPRL